MGQTRDAMATVAVSGQPELAEELLDKFVSTEQKEAFVLWIERVYAQPPKALADLKAKKTKLAGEIGPEL